MTSESKVYGSPTWKRVRQLVIARDQGICQICHVGGADAVDHIVPWREGGAWYDLDNLRLVHGKCNSSRVRRGNRVEAAGARRPSREW